MVNLNNLEILIENSVKLCDVEIFAQPLVSLKNTSNKKNFEILSRFKDNLGNYVNPETIFQSASMSNLEYLDRIIFENTFKTLNSLSKILGDDYMAAINVSEASIINGGSFLSFLELLRKQYSIKKENFQLEITERSDKCIFPFVTRALEVGYSISADDFASDNLTIGKVRKKILNGRSEDELSRIKIKIDMQFILNLANQYNPNFASDRAAINLALSLRVDRPQLTIVAEGIEDLETAKILKGYGIDYAQGFYFAKPKKLDETYSQPIFSNFL